MQFKKCVDIFVFIGDISANIVLNVNSGHGFYRRFISRKCMLISFAICFKVEGRLGSLCSIRN